MDTMDKMIAPAQAALATAKTMGASGAKIGVSRTETISVNFEAGRLKDTGGAQTLAFHVAVLVDGRRGSATCGAPDELRQAVGRAVELAKLGGVAHFAAWPAPAPSTVVPGHSEATAALTREALIDACQEVANTLRDYTPDLCVACSAARWLGESLLVTSGGVAHQRRDGGWSLGGSAQRTNGTDMLSVYGNRCGGEANASFSPKSLASELLFHLRHSERAAPAPTGQVKAFLTPEALGWFLW